MGTTRDDGVAAVDVGVGGRLAAGRGHPFYERLNRIFEAAGCDAFVTGLCGQFYAAKMCRPSLALERYFRLLLIGYFGTGLGACDRVAGSGFAERADVSAPGAAGVTAGPFDDARGRGVCFRSRLTAKSLTSCAS